jgi:hypothetical protein
VLRTRKRRAGRQVRSRGANDQGESPHEADLLSYLLFDGPFAATLMDMGYQDARRRCDQLGALLARDGGVAASRLQRQHEGRAAVPATGGES